MNVVHYHVGHNSPGCLPESWPICCESAQEAIDTWHRNITEALDVERLTDEQFLEIDTTRNTYTASDLDSTPAGYGHSLVIGSRTHWITVEIGDGSDCEVLDSYL